MSEYKICEIIIPLGPSKDQRPGVLTAIVNDDFYVLPMSSQMDMYDPTTHFLIPKNHPDFPATGLTKESYVFPELTVTDQSKIIRILGVLRGTLASDFDKWFGA